MISFVMVLALAMTTLYMGVYVAEALEALDMRRCPQANSNVNSARDK